MKRSQVPLSFISEVGNGTSSISFRVICCARNIYFKGSTPARVKNSLMKRTKLISERIIIEAKRELYLTIKTVKEIAYELGYDDEYYFSRFFKMNADVSAQLYRDTVGFGRGAA